MLIGLMKLSSCEWENEGEWWLLLEGYPFRAGNLIYGEQLMFAYAYRPVSDRVERGKKCVQLYDVCALFVSLCLMLSFLSLFLFLSLR